MLLYACILKYVITNKFEAVGRGRNPSHFKLILLTNDDDDDDYFYDNHCQISLKNIIKSSIPIC